MQGEIGRSLRLEIITKLINQGTNRRIMKCYSANVETYEKIEIENVFIGSKDRLREILK